MACIFWGRSIHQWFLSMLLKMCIMHECKLYISNFFKISCIFIRSDFLTNVPRNVPWGEGLLRSLRIKWNQDCCFYLCLLVIPIGDWQTLWRWKWREFFIMKHWLCLKQGVYFSKEDRTRELWTVVEFYKRENFQSVAFDPAQLLRSQLWKSCCLAWEDELESAHWISGESIPPDVSWIQIGLL